MLKIFYQLLLQSQFTTTCWGQILINGEEGNIIYAPLGNSIDLQLFDNCYELKVEIEGQNEKLSMTNCTFKINSLVKDTARLLVFHNGKVVQEKTLIEVDVKARPYISVDNQLIADNKISLEQFYKIDGLEIYYNCPFLKAQIREYTLFVEDENLGKVAINNQGNKLNRTALELLSTLKKPLSIYFEDIRYTPKFEHDWVHDLSISIEK